MLCDSTNLMSSELANGLRSRRRFGSSRPVVCLHSECLDVQFNIQACISVASSQGSSNFAINGSPICLSGRAHSGICKLRYTYSIRAARDRRNYAKSRPFQYKAEEIVQGLSLLFSRRFYHCTISYQAKTIG